MLQFIKLGSGNAFANTALKLTSADNGTTWSYYPPDGYNTAIIDGGNNKTRRQLLLPDTPRTSILGFILAAPMTLRSTV